MKSTSTAAAESAVDVEENIFSLQVIWQRATSRWCFGFRSEPWLRFLDAADVAVKVLKTERKLVGIEALGAASELHSLQLFDDWATRHGELGAFLIRDNELRAPAEQQPGDDAVLAREGRDLAPGSSVSLAIPSVSSPLKKASNRCRRRCRIADFGSRQAAFGL